MVKIYPFPDGEIPSCLYNVQADGMDISVHRCRVSAMPYNMTWPGHQRTPDQTEEAAFVTFGTDGAVKLAVKAAKPYEDYRVRPLSANVRTRKMPDGALQLDIPGPGFYTLELDGQHNALHIFADRIEDQGEGPGALCGDVMRFGPGVHRPGLIEVHSGQTVVIDAGAVVYGAIVGRQVRNVRICGFGILDNSWEERDDGSCIGVNGCFKFYDSDNITVENIVMRDSCTWCATLFRCTNVLFEGVKTVGMYRYNSDGIDFVNSSNCMIKRCFLRNFDDVVVLKGLKGWDDRNVENIFVQDCVLWCDWGRALEIGAETCADEYRNIIFEDCDIIHGDCILMDLQNGDRANVHGVRFERINCEYSKYQMRPVYQTDEEAPYAPGDGLFVPLLFKAHLYCGLWSDDYLLGENHDVELKDIHILADEGIPVPEICLQGADESHRTYDIRISGLYMNGKPVLSEELNLNIGNFAEAPEYIK